jgi:hypothetical protein
MLKKELLRPQSGRKRVSRATRRRSFGLTSTGVSEPCFGARLEAPALPEFVKVTGKFLLEALTSVLGLSLVR